MQTSTNTSSTNWRDWPQADRLAMLARLQTGTAPEDGGEAGRDVRRLLDLIRAAAAKRKSDPVAAAALDVEFAVLHADLTGRFDPAAFDEAQAGAMRDLHEDAVLVRDRMTD